MLSGAVRRRWRWQGQWRWGTPARLLTLTAAAKVNAKPYYITTPIFYPNAGLCVQLFVDIISDSVPTRARPTHRTPLFACARRHPRALPPPRLPFLAGALHHGHGRARAQDPEGRARQGRVRASTRRRAGRAFQGVSDVTAEHWAYSSAEYWLSSHRNWRDARISAIRASCARLTPCTKPACSTSGSVRLLSTLLYSTLSTER